MEKNLIFNVVPDNNGEPFVLCTTFIWEKFTGEVPVVGDIVIHKEENEKYSRSYKVNHRRIMGFQPDKVEFFVKELIDSEETDEEFFEDEDEDDEQD